MSNYVVITLFCSYMACVHNDTLTLPIMLFMITATVVGVMFDLRKWHK